MQLYRPKSYDAIVFRRAQEGAQGADHAAEFYPGAASLWWIAYRLAEPDNQRAAWEALANARQLEPNNRRFKAMSLLLAARALPEAEVEARLAGVRGCFDSAGAEVCLMHASAEIQLARASDRRTGSTGNERSKQPRPVFPNREEQGYATTCVHQTCSRRLCFAGAQPTMDILYRAGLSHLAVASSPDADIVDPITSSVRDAA